MASGFECCHHRAKLFKCSLCTPLLEGMLLAVSMCGAVLAHVTTRIEFGLYVYVCKIMLVDSLSTNAVAAYLLYGNLDSAKDVAHPMSCIISPSSASNFLYILSTSF